MPHVSEHDILLELAAPLTKDSCKKRILCWNAPIMRQWFIQRGYDLYTYVFDKYGEPTVMSFPSSATATAASAIFPYAYHGGDDNWGPETVPPLASRPHVWDGNIIYAQDKQGRHVTMKLVKLGSDEHRILQFVHENGIPKSEDEFNHIIPVLEFFPFGDHCFAVMPRWGDIPQLPSPSSIGQILKIFHSLLKAVTFLHRHKIAHGDIKMMNTLVNHFGKPVHDHHNPLRMRLRSEGRLTYALFDFNISTKFPLTSTLNECRLPYHRSWTGTFGHFPTDTAQGEFDFDPFAWDVCMLGLAFCYSFNSVICDVPMLVPLLDKMMWRDIPQRFTAAEALRFFEDELYSQLSEQQLLQSPSQEVCGIIPSADHDRWTGLDSQFIEKWAAFRQPPLPLATRIIRFICRYEWAHYSIIFIRRTVHLARSWC